MGRLQRVLLWAVVIVCLWPWNPQPPSPARSLSQRLLGPIASLVASAEWVRFDWYVQRGQFARAYAASDRALAMDPSSTQGWTHLASHMAFFRASSEGETQASVRRQWIHAGLSVLKRGEATASAPGDLAYLRGLILAWVADLESLGEPASLSWPGGAEQARLAGADAFHQAGLLGNLEGYLVEGLLRTGKRLEPPVRENQ